MIVISEDVLVILAVKRQKLLEILLVQALGDFLRGDPLLLAWLKEIVIRDTGLQNWWFLWERSEGDHLLRLGGLKQG